MNSIANSSGSRQPTVDRPHTNTDSPQPASTNSFVDSWQQSALKFNRTWLIALLLLGVASVAALLFVGDPQQTLSLIRSSNWFLLLLALLIHYSGFAVRGLRWKLILGALGHHRNYLYCTGLLICGWFVSAIVPARAGDILRIGVLRSSGQTDLVDDANASLHQDAQKSNNVPIADGVSSIFLERVLDIMAILLLGAGFGFLVLRTQLPNWVLSLYGTTVGLLLVLALALLVLPHVWDWLGRISEQSLWQKGVKFGSEITAKIVLLSQAPKIAMATIGLSLYIWLCDAFLLWLVMWSLGVVSTFGLSAFVALTVDVIAAVPLTPGGIGQIETAYGALLSLLSLPLEKLPAIILLTRFISYWSFLLFSGLITLVMVGMPHRR